MKWIDLSGGLYRQGRKMIKQKNALRFTILGLLLISCSLFQPASPMATPAVVTAEPSLVPAATTGPLLPTVTSIPTTFPSPATTLQATPAISNTAEAQGVGGRSAGDPYAQELGNTGYDVQHYTLKLALDPVAKNIQAEADIEILSRLENLRQFSLDFAGFQISSLLVSGKNANYQREGGKLIVDLPEPVPNGSTFQLSVQYSGQPLAETSRYVPFLSHIGMFFQINGTAFVMGEPNGAHYWFPCNDHPRDKATYRIELTVPVGMTGVSNGVLLEQKDGVANVFPDGRAGDWSVWESKQPIATAFVTVSAGNYKKLTSQSPKGVPLRSYSFQDPGPLLKESEATTGEALDWMSSLFGPYPFDAFGYVEVFDMGASLETQSMVLLTNDVIHNETVRVHELAHMWFGDWVSVDSWGDIWRSEGAATYFTLMWMDRNNPAGLEASISEYAQAIRNLPSGYPLNDPPPDQMFGSDSYVKGALVFHDLRAKMGDEAFFKGLKDYFQRYGGGAATQAQFQATMEEAAGFSLDSFFNEWFK